jgi:uncharacterized coiled-coil protein SlyX
MPRAAPWIQASVQPTVTGITTGNDDTTKILLLMNQNILEMKESTHRLNEKLDRLNDKVNQSALDNELHHKTLGSLIPTLLSIIKEFIWPMTNFNVAQLGSQQTKLQKYYTEIESLLNHLKNDYTERRRCNISPPPHLSPTLQPSKLANNNQNNDSDQNMTN